MASVPVGGPFLNFLPVISKEVKCFEKGMHTEIRFEGRVQVFFCPSILLFALEVEGEEKEGIGDGKGGSYARNGFFNLPLKNGNNLASV